MPQSTSQIQLKLGTRGSRLALAQAEMVAAALGANTGVACEIVIVKTSGDRIQDRSLADAGGKGLFTKELEERLFAREIDIAVHSMKDVPVLMPDGLCIAALLPREDPREAFLSHKANTLADLPPGARLGTSSVRRHAQMARARPDLVIKLLRGNVDTRLRKLDDGEFDAIMLAVAGLKRLGLQARITKILEPNDWLPSLAQGAVGVQLRANDTAARAAVSRLNDTRTEIELACERAFQDALDGSCRSPIAGLARYENGTLRFRGEVLAPDGRNFIETEFESALDRGAVEEAARLGREAGASLRPHAAAWLNA